MIFILSQYSPVNYTVLSATHTLLGMHIPHSLCLTAKSEVHFMCALYLDYNSKLNQHLTMHLTMYEYGIYFWRGSAASSLPYTTEYKETNEPSHTRLLNDWSIQYVPVVCRQEKVYWYCLWQLDVQVDSSVRRWQCAHEHVVYIGLCRA